MPHSMSPNSTPRPLEPPLTTREWLASPAALGTIIIYWMGVTAALVDAQGRLVFGFADTVLWWAGGGFAAAVALELLAGRLEADFRLERGFRARYLARVADWLMSAAVVIAAVAVHDAPERWLGLTPLEGFTHIVFLIPFIMLVSSLKRHTSAALRRSGRAVPGAPSTGSSESTGGEHDTRSEEREPPAKS